MPILVPVVIIAIIAGTLFGFSRILLALTPTSATVTAIIAGMGVLVVASVASSRKQVRLSTLGAMVGATAGIAMLAGGIALAVVGGSEEGPGGQGRPVVTLAAFNIAFEPTQLTVPAGEPFTLEFNNKDTGVQHNVEIFDNPDHNGTPLFSGDLVTGVRTEDYAVGALEPGKYFFQCVVHPQMTGEMQAVEQAGGPGGQGPGGGGGVTVVAQNIQFDISKIELPAGTPTTITFENRDAGVQHNIAIFTNSSLDNELFDGDLLTGPGTAQYEVPALDPGEYYFHCNVHPNMNGTVVVSDKGGGGGGGSPPPTGPS